MKETCIQSIIIAFAVIGMLFPANLFGQAEQILDIHFPVEGEVTFSNDFDHPRGDKLHRATDIFAEKLTPVLAAQDGVITFMPIPEPSWGFGIFMRGNDGYNYHYIHLNNDTPGTDDGEGGPKYAYAHGLKAGSRVERGQVIGWLGDSGNAEQTPPHLHFEIEDKQGNRINPYFSLLKAYAEQQGSEDSGAFDPDLEQKLGSTISMALKLSPKRNVDCEAEALLKTPDSTVTYYCGVDGGLYMFPNEHVYFSWYEDFSDIKTVAADAIVAVPIRGFVPYRPGWQLVKRAISSKIYAVAHGGVLRPIPSPEIAAAIFGKNWSKLVHDLYDLFFAQYEIGEVVEGATT